jgi:N-acetylmuramoyl-L-alanine amidase
MGGAGLGRREAPRTGDLHLVSGIATLLALACAVTASAAELRDVRSIISPDYTRLVLDLGEQVSYRLQPVSAHPNADVPARLYVDLEGTRLPRRFARMSFSGGPLVRLRGVDLPHGGARLILDVPGLHDYRAFPLLDPFRLVVDVEGELRPVAASTPKKADTLQAVRAAVTATSAAQQEATAPKRTGLRVMLDPGHGGKDPGARGVGGVLEKDVVLAVAQKLRRRLESSGIEVLMTREQDVFLSLEERTARANAAKVDLFVSIHANASLDSSASGIETYYLSNTNDRATIRLAQMENHLAYMTGRRTDDSDVSWILSDMIQRYKIDESSRLAEQVQTALVRSVSRVHPDVRDLGAKPGPFYVLVGAGMPGILVEISFLTHRQEGVRLADPAYQNRLVDGLLRGIERFDHNQKIADTL